MNLNAVTFNMSVDKLELGKVQKVNMDDASFPTSLLKRVDIGYIGGGGSHDPLFVSRYNTVQ